jgi:membrane protease YdiL (CAAX protease family)
LTISQWGALASEMLGAIAVTMLVGLSPRVKQQRPLGFKYPLREGIISLVLYAVLLGFNFLVQNGQVFQPGAGVSDALIPVYLQLVAAGAGVLLFGAALAYRRQPLRSAGWNRALMSPAIQAGISIVLLSIFLRGMISRLMGGLTSEQGTALLFFLALALAEESIFRGYIQLRLMSWLGTVPGWLSTSLLFVLWQVPHLSGLAGAALWIKLGIALAQGLVAGWMMIKCRHVLAPALYRAISTWLTFLG